MPTSLGWMIGCNCPAMCVYSCVNKPSLRSHSQLSHKRIGAHARVFASKQQQSHEQLLQSILAAKYGCKQRAGSRRSSCSHATSPNQYSPQRRTNGGQTAEGSSRMPQGNRDTCMQKAESAHAALCLAVQVGSQQPARVCPHGLVWMRPPSDRLAAVSPNLQHHRKFGQGKLVVCKH